MTFRALRSNSSSLFAFAVALTLLATACSSTSGPQPAGEVLFPAGQPTPTVVEPAEPIDETNNETSDDSEDDDTAPPERLAFADWTVNDIVDRLTTAINSPITVKFTGNGDEILELDGDQWRVVGTDRTPPSSDQTSFVILGSGDEEWVTYEQVTAGALAAQAFEAASLGISIDELLAEPERAPELDVQKFLLDRAIIDETGDLSTAWVPYERTDDAFFTATLLTPELAETILTDVAIAIADADLAGELTITSNQGSIEAKAPDTSYSSVVVGQDQSITITSVGGWTLSLSNGVADPTLLGEPSQPNVLTRELLLTATSVPAGCVTPTIEAQSMVDNGFTSCNDADEIAAILDQMPDDTEDLGTPE